MGVIISHNREFTNAVTTEKWIMEKGRLRREGESVAKEEEKKDTFEDKNEKVFDSFGNEVIVEKKVELNEKEKNRELKKLQKMLKEGKKKGILTESEINELEDKIDELKGEE